MSKDPIRALLTGKAPPDPAELGRKLARVAWVRRTMRALKAAQRKADQAWMRAVRGLPDDATEEELEAVPEPPEQAELDRLHALIRAVIDDDKWPREMHWSAL